MAVPLVWLLGLAAVGVAVAAAGDDEPADPVEEGTANLGDAFVSDLPERYQWPVFAENMASYLEQKAQDVEKSPTKWQKFKRGFKATFGLLKKGVKLYFTGQVDKDAVVRNVKEFGDINEGKLRKDAAATMRAGTADVMLAWVEALGAYVHEQTGAPDVARRIFYETSIEEMPLDWSAYSAAQKGDPWDYFAERYGAEMQGARNVYVWALETLGLD